jgi:thioredoxin 1
MMGPVIEELSEERTDIKFVKINVDENMDLAARFRVMSIPTLLIFKNGEVVRQSVGALQKEEVLKLLEEL